jgi:hypothetical protein
MLYVKTCAGDRLSYPHSRDLTSVPRCTTESKRNKQRRALIAQINAAASQARWLLANEPVPLRPTL